MTSMRRLERAILSTPVVLKAVVGLSFSKKSSMVADFTNQFVPILRYHNPKLTVKFPDAEDPKSQGSLDLIFSDDTTDSIPLDPLPQSHALMEKLLTVDTTKYTLKDKYLPSK